MNFSFYEIECGCYENSSRPQQDCPEFRRLAPEVPRPGCFRGVMPRGVTAWRVTDTYKGRPRHTLLVQQKEVDRGGFV